MSYKFSIFATKKNKIMTDKEKLEAIIAEIKKVKEVKSVFDNKEDRLIVKYCNHFLSFIDSLS